MVLTWQLPVCRRLENPVIILFLDIVVDVDIYNSKDEALNENDVYDLNVGDYLECRAAEQINPMYPPHFIWFKSIQVENIYGPRIINYQNQNDNTNR